MFKKAHRQRVKLKLAITGPSGSGKTYSALRLATGIGGRIAVVDTENGSASLYSDRFEFDVMELKSPYTVPKFIEAVEVAVKEGFDILILDSISHQWRGEGGILSKKEQLDARGGNSFANWAKMTPEQEKFVSQAITNSNIHVIATIRSKQDHALVEGDKGKQKVQKLGLAPIQREGIEYEFTTVFDVAMNHEAATSKDRTGLFMDRVFQITEETGEELRTWLLTAKEPEQEASKKEVETNETKKETKEVATVTDADFDKALAKYGGAEMGIQVGNGGRSVGNGREKVDFKKFVIQGGTSEFTKKHKGKLLTSVPKPEVAIFLTEMRKKMDETKEEATGAKAEFIEAATNYLESGV